MGQSWSVRGEPPNQRKLGGLSLRLNEADCGGDGKHPPIRRNGTGDTDGQDVFLPAVVGQSFAYGHSLCVGVSNRTSPETTTDQSPIDAVASIGIKWRPSLDRANACGRGRVATFCPLKRYVAAREHLQQNRPQSGFLRLLALYRLKILWKPLRCFPGNFVSIPSPYNVLTL